MPTHSAEPAGLADERAAESGSSTADSSATDPHAAPSPRDRTEQLHLRNHDGTRRYRVTVSVSKPGQPPVYEATYDLAPGEVTAEFEAVPVGQYDVRVDAAFRPTDDAHRDGTAGTDSARAVCDIGDRVSRTVAVECGNGIVDVSPGMR
jgi:hypothetical protein